MIGQTNAITGHFLVVMDDRENGEGFLGWIRLANGEADAGYLYISDKPQTPRLGGRDERPYIVMSRPRSELAALLAFLGDGRGKTIRYSSETSSGGSVFLEHDESRSASNSDVLAGIRD